MERNDHDTLVHCAQCSALLDPSCDDIHQIGLHFVCADCLEIYARQPPCLIDYGAAFVSTWASDFFGAFLWQFRPADSPALCTSLSDYLFKAQLSFIDARFTEWLCFLTQRSESSRQTPTHAAVSSPGTSVHWYGTFPQERKPT